MKKWKLKENKRVDISDCGLCNLRNYCDNKNISYCDEVTKKMNLIKLKNGEYYAYKTTEDFKKKRF